MSSNPDERDEEPASNAAPKARVMDLGVLDETFGYVLRRAWRDVDRRFQHFFRTVALTAPQYSILILVDRNAGCTPGDLVQPMGISQNNLVGIVGDLIDRGYVDKVTDARDRRARILTLTDAGRVALAAAHEVHELHTREQAERIGEDKMRELVRLLRAFDEG